MLRTQLDEYFVNAKAGMPYPCLMIKGIGEEFPFVEGALEEGDLPVIVYNNGKNFMLSKKISSGARCIKKLCKLYAFDIALSKDEIYHVQNIYDYMEVLETWMLSSSC